MKHLSDLSRESFGVFPTPFYQLKNISAKYGKNIWIKRDDMCGVALGGNKVRKLEFLLADAKAQGCDYTEDVREGVGVLLDEVEADLTGGGLAVAVEAQHAAEEPCKLLYKGAVEQ